MKVTLQTTLRAAVLLGTTAITNSTLACGDYTHTLHEPVSVTMASDQGAIVAGATSEIVLKLQVCGHDTSSNKKHLPLNVAVVLDRSGSMEGIKIEQAKQAASHLLRQLGAADRFSLVTYDDHVNLLIPPAPVIDTAPLLKQINSIKPGGSTALYAGVSSGAEQLKTFLSSERVNRVILLSDGIANVGPSSPAEISALGRTLANSGIPVTTVGLGTNYQEDVLSSLAEASDANYYYVADIEKLPEVFDKEFNELHSIVARDVSIRIECGEGITPIGFAGREAGTTSLTFSSLSANQKRDVYFRCRVDADKEIRFRDLAKVTSEWIDQDGKKVHSESKQAQVEIVASAKEAEARRNTSVATDYEILTTNLAKEKAIIAADAGQTTIARNQLSSLRANLAALIPSAPSEKQALLRQEVDDLEESIQDFDQNRGRFSRRNRKSLQDQNWTIKNSKR